MSRRSGCTRAIRSQLIQALAKLRDLGNTLLLVEHDRDVIASADRLLDFGPRAGADGGEIVGSGTPTEFMRRRRKADDDSLTRAYLGGSTAIAVPTNRRAVAGVEAGAKARLEKVAGEAGAAEEPQEEGQDAGEAAAGRRLADGGRGARQHNLRNLTVPIRLQRLH
jgi:excinuclease ABC subunit A